MCKPVDPVEFGLKSSTKIEKIDRAHLAIVINRKSRIIMKDGQNIMNKVEMMKKVDSNLKISLKTSTPICSKTIVYLNSNGIDIIKI
jgi:hypothetical protein